MKRHLRNYPWFIFAALLLACAALTSLAACSAGGSQDTASSASLESKGLSDSDETLVSGPVEEIDYSEGIHHAELVIEDYEDFPIQIEIYSHSAPVTAEKFARMVDSGYFDGKPVFWALKDMYVRLGNVEQDDDYLITGEYDESDFKNSNSLKKGVIAVSRAADGQQSDASSLIVFMSDLSFLDGKYAGFAKITENYEVIDWIAGRTQAGGDLVIDESGRILNTERYPVIKSITMID